MIKKQKYPRMCECVSQAVDAKLCHEFEIQVTNEQRFDRFHQTKNHEITWFDTCVAQTHSCKGDGTQTQKR